MSLEQTQHELEATAQQVASIACELNAVAKDLCDSGVLATLAETSNDYGVLTTAVETSGRHCGQLRTAEKWREHLRLRALGLQAEAGRLALAALNARAAAEQIACASRQGAEIGGILPNVRDSHLG